MFHYYWFRIINGITHNTFISNKNDSIVRWYSDAMTRASVRVASLGSSNDNLFIWLWTTQNKQTYRIIYFEKSAGSKVGLQISYSRVLSTTLHTSVLTLVKSIALQRDLHCSYWIGARVIGIYLDFPISAHLNYTILRNASWCDIVYSVF